MASLLSTGRLGTSSVSSLIKSANSTASAMLTLQTNIADQQWSDSAKTDADYKTYTDTISGLLGKAKGDTTISGQDKVISLQNKLTNAGTSYNSAQIKRAQINILQGTGTQADKVNLLSQLYTRASDPNDQQSILMQYDQAVKTLNDQNVAAANKAASEAQSNLQKGYTRVNTQAGTLMAQIAASIQTGTNQIDPQLLSGKNTVFLNKDGTVSFNQAQAQPGSKSVTISIPAKGQSMNVIDLAHLSGMVLGGQYRNEANAAVDPGLTADQQNSHNEQAANLFKDVQKNIAFNARVATAEQEGEPAIVRQYIDGVWQLKENPNVDAAGKYTLNPAPQKMQAALSAAAKSGNTAGVDFYMQQNGIPTQFKLKSLGNAVIAVDQSASDPLTAKAYLYDKAAGQLVPFSAQHQAQFNEARSIPNPVQSQAAETAMVNGVQAGYQKAHMPASKPGVVAQAGTDLKKATTTLISKIDTTGKKLFGPGAAPAPKAPDFTHDPLGRLGNGLVDEIGKAIPGLGVVSHISDFLGHLAGSFMPKPVQAPVTHPNVPPPNALANVNELVREGKLAFGGGPVAPSVIDNSGLSPAQRAAWLHGALTSPQAAQVSAQAAFNPATAPITGNSARDVSNLVSGLTGGAIPGAGL